VTLFHDVKLIIWCLTCNGQNVGLANLTPGQVVNTWMGDCLWTGKPSKYITSHRGQLSLSSLWGR